MKTSTDDDDDGDSDDYYIYWKILAYWHKMYRTFELNTRSSSMQMKWRKNSRMRFNAEFIFFSLYMSPLAIWDTERCKSKKKKKRRFYSFEMVDSSRSLEGIRVQVMENSNLILFFRKCETFGWQFWRLCIVTTVYMAIDRDTVHTHTATRTRTQ